MSRRKPTVVVSPQPNTSVLRRSARLVSLQNRDGQGKPEKGLAFGSEPPRKIRRGLGSQVPSKRLVFEEGSSSMDGSLRGLSASNNVSCSCNLRRSPRFSSGGGGSVDCQCSCKSGNSRCSKKSVSSEIVQGGGDSVKSRNNSRSRSRTKGGCDDGEEVSVFLSKSKGKRTRIAKPNKGENVVPKANEGKRIGKEEELKTKNKLEKGRTEEPGFVSCTLRRSPRFSSGGGSVDASSKGRKSSDSVLDRCCLKSERGKRGDGVECRDTSRSRLRPKTRQMYRECDEDEECFNEGKEERIAKENAVPKPEECKNIEKEGLKTKNKLTEGWTEELELALQGAYLTVKPSPHFWKNVSKMVPGKSAQECFDRVNSDLITPRQLQPRSRASKTNLSPIPQFSLSASKLLKPSSPKTKIRHRRNNVSKKTIRHLLEKQNQMDQGLGFDLFSVFEPGTTSSLLSTPVEKGQRLPKILESPLPYSRFASKDKTTLVSPPVLKQVKNKALHERYIDHVHIREAKRKSESTRLARKENIRPVDDNQKKDSVKAVKDALLFDVQDAIQKLKGLEAEKSSSSSDFGYDRGETDEEDESI